jgi:hypothetical protein
MAAAFVFGHEHCKVAGKAARGGFPCLQGALITQNQALLDFRGT